MLERADAFLAAVPVLAASGFVLRSLIAATGVGTGLLAAPLAASGALAALTLVVGELLVGPVARRSGDERP